MSDVIVVAIITSTVTLTVNLLSNNFERKKAAIQQARREQKLDDQITALDKKVTSHNAYAEKFASMTGAITAIQKDIEWIKQSGRK